MRYCAIVNGEVDCDGICSRCRIAEEYDEMLEDFMDADCEVAGIESALIRSEEKEVIRYD